MKSYRDIEIKDYNYNLPAEKIARYPLDKREASKLLVYSQGKIIDDSFLNISSYINRDKTLIFNETEVIRSRLIFRKSTGASIEIFCLEPHSPTDYELSLSSTGPIEWKCIVGNLKKWKNGPLTMSLEVKNHKVSISANRISRADKHVLVRFDWDDKSICFSEILEAHGHMPVPPYLNREDEPIDNLRYQTIYSANKGSVAAPTAGLHFSGQVLSKIIAKGIHSGKVTLHVSAGTFIPVKSDTIGQHQMHREHFFVSRETIELLKAERIIAVGTTSVRTIETLYHLGNKLLDSYSPDNNELVLEQWEAYENKDPGSRKASLDALLAHLDNTGSDHVRASTSIIIVPGYKFRIVEGLITNYHMPSSTLLLLVAALIGDDWKNVYSHALNNNYRFLSYGDSSLLMP